MWRLERDLAGDGLVERVPVQRLNVDGTAAMIDSIVGSVDASAVYRQSRGNPFSINAMLHALRGRYCLIRQVGRRGMGRVFEAIDSGTGDQVAVKIMFARTEADPRALATYGAFGSGPGEFKQPSAVAVDGQGNIYVADYYNNRAQKLSPSGKPIWGSRGRFPGR